MALSKKMKIWDQREGKSQDQAHGCCQFFFSCPLSLLQVIIDVSVKFTYELEDSSCSWKDAACSFLPGIS